MLDDETTPSLSGNGDTSGFGPGQWEHTHSGRWRAVVVKPPKSLAARVAPSIIVGVVSATGGALILKACSSCSIGTFEPPYVAKEQAATKIELKSVETKNEGEHVVFREDLAEIKDQNGAMFDVLILRAKPEAANKSYEQKRAARKARGNE